MDQTGFGKKRTAPDPSLTDTFSLTEAHVETKTMEPGSALQKLIPLDLPSEGLLVWEHGCYSQTDYAAFLLKGPCDTDAFKQAFLEAQEGRPTFHANLIRVPKGLWGARAWRISEKPNELEVRDFTHLEDLPDPLDTWIHGQMSPHIQTLQDLTVEFPIRLILFQLPKDHAFLVMMLHHVATDGGGVYEFLRHLFHRYHLAVKGEPSEWADVAGMHAQAGKITPVAGASNGAFIKQAIADARRYPLGKMTTFVTTPEAPSGRFSVRRVIEDPAQQKAMRDRARRDGGTLTDLIVAGSKLAIEQWNTQHNELSETMAHGIAVNQRLRRDPKKTKGQGNPMSAVNVPSGPEERKDPEKLLRYVIEQRTYRMAQGHDLALARFSRGLLQISRILPSILRYRALRVIFDAKISHFITNLGVIWPQIENGRVTGKTAVRRVGDLEIMEMYSSVGPTENNPKAIIVRTFLGRLYLDMTYGKWGANEADAKDFSDLLYDKVMSYL